MEWIPQALLVAGLVFAFWFVCAIVGSMFEIEVPKSGWKRDLYEFFKLPVYLTLGMLMLALLLMDFLLGPFLKSPTERARESYYPPF